MGINGIGGSEIMQEFEIIEYNKLRVFVALCNRHAEIWENNFWDDEE